MLIMEGKSRKKSNYHPFSVSATKIPADDKPIRAAESVCFSY
jgi:hypothetical protein